GLRGRDGNGMAIYPDRTTEEIVPYPSAQRLNQLLSPLELKRDHVNDDVRIHVRNQRSECTFGLLGTTVHTNMCDGLPGRMRPVGHRAPAADVDNVVSTLHQRGHE